MTTAKLEHFLNNSDLNNASYKARKILLILCLMKNMYFLGRNSLTNILLDVLSRCRLNLGGIMKNLSLNTVHALLLLKTLVFLIASFFLSGSAIAIAATALFFISLSVIIFSVKQCVFGEKEDSEVEFCLTA